MSKSSATIAIILALVAGFFLGNVTAKRGEGETPSDAAADAAGAAAEGTQEEIYRVPVGNSPSKGPRDALVTIIEFSEFQCPFCSKVTPTLERIEREYRGKVRIVFKHNPLPFHKNAMIASEAAMAANAQGKFWEMGKVLFDNQRALERADLERYAQQVGLDMTRFKADMDGHAHQRAIEADQRLAQQLGARGTPAFFINGRNVRGALPFEQFKTIIDEELARAERVLKTGVPKSRLYAELTKGGRTSPPAAAAGADQAKREPRQREDPTAVYKVPIDGAPVQGPATALVTIVEFSDFQ